MKQTRSAVRCATVFSRMLLAAALAVLIPMAVAPVAAQGEEPLRWFGDSFDDITMLVYGVPHSDYVAVIFGCKRGERFVKVGLQDEDSGAEEGVPLPIRMAAAGRQIEFSEKGVRNQDSGGIELHARLPLDETLRRILGSSGRLDITIAGRTQHYDMAGAAKMLAACDAATAGQ